MKDITIYGNTAGPLYVRYAVKFFVISPKFAAGILTYFKVNLGDMTENLQVDGVQRREPVVVWCCLKYNYIIHSNTAAVNKM